MYETKTEVLEKALNLVESGLTFGELDTEGRLGRGKGDLGQIIESGWFNYAPNNNAEPDFAAAGVELKVSPYKMTTAGISAKERLVCDIINYMTEADVSFEESAFWKKCKCILLLSYLWESGKRKADFKVDYATLLDGYPEEDLLIIKNDWQIIVEKIRAGQAHLLTEGDTMYLAASTKGSTAEASYRAQPYSDIPAKQRAYSLKTTYMTQILRKYIAGIEEDEHIIKSPRQLENATFEDVLIGMFQPYIGRDEASLMREFSVDSTAKHRHAILAARIMGLKRLSSEELTRAGITVKTIVREENGFVKENMSFPAFSFSELLETEWEDSEPYQKIAAAKFFFIAFRKQEDRLYLEQVRFWNLSVDDVDELHRVWQRTIISIQNNCNLTRQNGYIENSLPKMSESYLSHVRPHTSRSAYFLQDGTRIGKLSDSDRLPNGERMTKQCFWLNRGMIRRILDE